MEKQRTIVVLGGAQAGPTAAARARETDENARIVLIERARQVSYAAAGLAYHLSGEVAHLDDLDRETARKFQDEFAVEVRTSVAVTRIDAEGRAVEMGGERLPYDSLVYALGAESPLPGGLPPAKNVFRFRTLVDLAGIVGAISAGKRRVAVLGAGFFGVEAADGLSRRGLPVVLIERGARVLSAFSPAVSRLATEALAAQGVRLLAGARLREARLAGDEVVELVLDNGQQVPVDFVIAAAGIAPRTQLLEKAGARLLPDGSLAVDERMRTSLPDIYACGVCAGVKHRLTGEGALVAQASVADKTAQIAGANAAGAELAMPGVLGTAIVRAGRLVCARTGLPWDAPGVEVTRVQARSSDVWFPGSAPLTIELRHDPRSGRLLGADVAGEQGADKRIDVLATAIAGGLSVGDLASLDLGYCPPFATARDAVNLAAGIAAAPARPNLRKLSPAEVLAEPRAFVAVDVRDEREARTDSHPALTTARRLPLPQLRARFAELPKAGDLLFVDDTGRLAYLAACIAQQRGRSAAWLSGGLRALGLAGRGE
jgi:NADPH-dependent 2,4-dienoyl-CoA reductase/sulfur reductase-like enzyme/rhodanese-related sulfurtransferase